MTIIKFEDRKKTNDLNDLLETAVDLRNRVKEKGEDLALKNLPIHIRGKIMDIMISSRLVEGGEIICGIYVAEILISLVRKIPESWYAVDYLFKAEKSSDPSHLKEGANLCFLLCALFPARTNRLRRPLKLEHYQGMGTGLYLRFYHKAKKEIGYLMAKNFRSMAFVASRCIKEI